MASQGAGFAFDMSNMDFGTSYTMSQQQQQPASKPLEGNTSTSFFFGDEGIDTSGSFCIDTLNPALLSLPQEQAYMSQNLTMDNTLVNTSTTAWDDQLASNMFNSITTFMPPTPSQSFDSIYPQQTQLGNALGKRSLHLDVHDYPVAKRHESLGEYPTISPLHSSAATTASWALDTQPTPASSVVVGLSDEAADVCTMWFNKYAVLPSDKHIDSLSQLTGESADAIRSWFGRLIKEGMGMSDSHGSDSAYRSQTVSNQQEQFWNDQLLMESIPHTQPVLPQQQEVTTTPEVTLNHDTTATTSPPTTTLRGSKKRCTPTNDPELLGRDSNKIYQCTRKCGKRYGRKCDWKRNEEEGYPCKSWVCSLCTSEDVQNVKPCFRKYHFSQHFRNIHPGLNADDYDESSTVCSETEFPRRCGFCRHRFDSRQDRIDHIADHFKQGMCMIDWNDDNSDDGEDSDDSNDDDNRPSGDDFDDGKPSYQPPGDDSRSGSNSKYYGGGNGSGGNSGGDGGASQGGFFQFQLSQLSQLEGGNGTNQCPIQEHIISPSSATEGCQQHPERTLHPGESSSHVRKHVSEEECCADALARDVISSTMIRTRQPRLVPEKIRSSSSVSSDVTSPATLSSCGYCLPPTPAQSSSTVTAHDSRDISHGSPKALPVVTTPVPAYSFLSVKLLGSGGFSTVDEVIHRETNLRISRKTLKNRDRSAIEELQKEVNVLKKLRHPHVIRFLGSYSKGDKMSILLSPVAEMNLALWLNQVAIQKPTDLFDMVSKMSGCLLSSVRYLHEQRPAISHGDIKPQNILVTQGDQGFPHVVLSDFGTSSSDGLDKEQFKPLTRRYIAPEVLKGLPRKEAADIWSLGCVFLEMICCAFEQSDAQWLKNRVGKCYWQDVQGLQDGLSTLLLEASTVNKQTVVNTVKAMLSPEPDERPSAALLSLSFAPASCCLNWANENVIFPDPSEELLAAEKISHEEGIDCCNHAHFNGSNANTHEQDAFANVNCWLAECSHSHEACRQPGMSHANTLPTRLVDIHPNGKDGTHVRVLNSVAIEPRHDPTEYIALSHMQTLTSPALLSGEFLSTQQVDFKRDNLPKSYEQAIQAAQRLGHRYIWDDSLCILQDSEADKRKECSDMAAVFRNAALTIVLDQLESYGSSNSGNEAVHNALPCHHQTPFHHNESYSPQPGVIDFAAPGFGWNTRAWVLQERLLSRRLLHLGAQQMYWECNALKASSTFPRGLAPLVWEKVHTRPSSSYPSPVDTNHAFPLPPAVMPTPTPTPAMISIPTPTTLPFSEVCPNYHTAPRDNHIPHAQLQDKLQPNVGVNHTSTADLQGDARYLSSGLASSSGSNPCINARRDVRVEAQSSQCATATATALCNGCVFE